MKKLGGGVGELRYSVFDMGLVLVGSSIPEGEGCRVSDPDTKVGPSPYNGQRND